MFNGQWEFTVMILGNSLEVSIPMFLIWIILFLIGLAFILAQIEVSFALPSGQTITTNVFGGLFHWFLDGLKGLL